MSACSDEISKIVIMCSGMTGCSSNQQKKKKKSKLNKINHHKEKNSVRNLRRSAEINITYITTM